ncbi:hypothetical protein M0804_009136 [Polistes exclamans]|nr:hypothetical protein M0804_009136 [Polistes exclamans]
MLNVLVYALLVSRLTVTPPTRAGAVLEMGMSLQRVAGRSTSCRLSSSEWMELEDSEDNDFEEKGDCRGNDSGEEGGGYATLKVDGNLTAFSTALIPCDVFLVEVFGGFRHLLE